MCAERAGGSCRADHTEIAANANSAEAAESADSNLCADLEQLFNRCFGTTWGVRLSAFAEEPLYRPATDLRPALLGYVRAHPRSALHEIAHWCIAGRQRRAQQDFGYWYAPDGRDAAAQAAFERVEVLPQALELLFCTALGIPFEVSLDNLTGAASDEAARARFDAAVRTAAAGCQACHRPVRALQFAELLTAAARTAARRA